MTKQGSKFVVLHHYDCPDKQDHLDILIKGFVLLGEEESPLMKFETLDEPSSVETAEYKGNIRDRYLTYQGPMSGGRGEVRRVDGGDWHFNDQGEIVLNGAKINGRYILVLRRIE